MSGRPRIAGALTVSIILSPTAIAGPADHGTGDATDASVIVMRGSQAQVPTGRQENGVIVMRPAPGSFLRETTRLAAEAEARNERAAREEARETNSRLVEALRAVEVAANTVERRRHSDRYLIFAPKFTRSVSGRGTGKSRTQPVEPAPSQ